MARLVPKMRCKIVAALFTQGASPKSETLQLAARDAQHRGTA